MAKIKFMCASGDDTTIQVHQHENREDFLHLKMYYEGVPTEIFLDKSTAIKFAKTLRTEINKIQL